MILNGATGAIGGVVIQLCAMLKLRAIAVVRRHETGPASDPVAPEPPCSRLGRCVSAAPDTDPDLACK